MAAGTRRVLLAALGALALLALVGAGLTWALAPDAAPSLLVGFLVLLVGVVVAEVVLVVLDRRRAA